MKPYCQRTSWSGVIRTSARAGNAGEVSDRPAGNEQAAQTGDQTGQSQTREAVETADRNRHSPQCTDSEPDGGHPGGQTSAHGPPQAAKEYGSQHQSGGESGNEQSEAAHSVPSSERRMARCSLLNQRPAFAHPRHNPATSSASVQVCVPGWCSSNQRPSSAPSSVGRHTDQPMSPNMPSPCQTGERTRRALSLRSSCAPIWTLKDWSADRGGSGSGTFQLDKFADQTTLQPGQGLEV